MTTRAAKNVKKTPGPKGVAKRAAAQTTTVRTTKSPGLPWWRAQAGRFANDPVFDEALKLGRAMREASEDVPSRKAKPSARTGH